MDRVHSITVEIAEKHRCDCTHTLHKYYRCLQVRRGEKFSGSRSMSDEWEIERVVSSRERRLQRPFWYSDPSVANPYVHTRYLPVGYRKYFMCRSLANWIGQETV